MTGLRVELVLNPAVRLQRDLALRLRQAMGGSDQLCCISLEHWHPHPCRLPGEPGDRTVVLVICAAAWCRRWGQARNQTREVLLLVEWVDGRAHEIGPALNWQAVWQGQTAARFAVLIQAADQPWHSTLQVAIPLLQRWRQQQDRFVAVTADYLIWWMRLCEQRHRLHPVAPGAAIEPSASPRLHWGQPGLTRARWLLQRTRSRLRWPNQAASNTWQVGVAWCDGSGDRIHLRHQLKPRGADWFADPFLISDGRRTWLFCERWDSAKGKGVIDLFELQPTGLRRCGTVLEEAFHLSFPRVIRSNGQWYATVESGANGEVRLYRALVFPTLWQLERQLLVDQAWVDPILLITADGCWLLVNRHSNQHLPRETAPELHLFHSPDLLHGSFCEHAASPLLIDSTCGRNGGVLNLQGNLHRVSQGTGADNAYGASVQIHSIDQLDIQAYRERGMALPWLTRLPQLLQASHMHTLNNCGPWLTFDYRRGGA